MVQPEGFTPNPGQFCVEINNLSSISGLSPFQLVRGFAKVTGFTPHAYLIQRRLHLARQMIVAGASLADVAQASGFADQSHMTRLFVQAHGISPGRYADAMR